MRYAILNSVRLKALFLILVLCCALPNTVAASDWRAPAQQLARKIVAVTGPGAVAVTFENRSSLSKKDFDAISNALRVELESLGMRSVAPEQAATSVEVSLSENPRLYVWVAEIHQGTAEPAVVMVSAPRDDEPGLAHEALPISLRKIPL